MEVNDLQSLQSYDKLSISNNVCTFFIVGLFAVISKMFDCAVNVYIFYNKNNSIFLFNSVGVILLLFVAIIQVSFYCLEFEKIRGYRMKTFLYFSLSISILLSCISIVLVNKLFF